MLSEPLEFILTAWAAWTPGIDTAQGWQNWSRQTHPIGDGGTPDVTFLPAMLRRRINRLDKMALWAVHHCLGTQRPDYAIFCSRHGELVQTEALLQAIERNDDVSPAGFSASVHNTAAGLYSLINEDRTATTAMGAGCNTFVMGMLEAVTELRCHPHKKVLLVCYDEVVPQRYSSFLNEKQVDYAAAFLLSVASEQGTKISLTGTDDASEANDTWPLALQFIQFLLGDSCHYHARAGTYGWTWQKR